MQVDSSLMQDSSAQGKMRAVGEGNRYDALVQSHIGKRAAQPEWGDRQAVEKAVADGMCAACGRMGGWHQAWCQLIIAIRGNTGWINTEPLTQAEIDRFNAAINDNA